MVNLLLIFSTFMLAVHCAESDCAQSGCWRPDPQSYKYCWKYCDKDNKKWCFTRSRRVNCPMVDCDTDEDCNGCWECAGACAASS